MYLNKIDGVSLRRCGVGALFPVYFTLINEARKGGQVRDSLDLMEEELNRRSFDELKIIQNRIQTAMNVFKNTEDYETLQILKDMKEHFHYHIFN